MFIRKMFGVKEAGGRRMSCWRDARWSLSAVCSRFYSRAADEMEMSQAEPGRARGLTVVHRMKILDIKQDREEKRREKNEKKRRHGQICTVICPPHQFSFCTGFTLRRT